MGVEAVAAAGALLGGGAAVAGAAESRKAGKHARREADLAHAEATESKRLASEEKKRLTNIEKEARMKVEKNRKRLKGGLFGEEREANTKLG